MQEMTSLTYSLYAKSATSTDTTLWIKRIADPTEPERVTLTNMTRIEPNLYRLKLMHDGLGELFTMIIDTRNDWFHMFFEDDDFHIPYAFYA